MNANPENLQSLPFVSVIIPAYKIAEYIAETLDSVFAQTYPNFEVIVINDGSPDTPEFEKAIEKFRDKIVYLTQENKGVGPARNTGIEHSNAEIFAFLDGDDVWLPTFLESQVQFLQAHNFDLVYCDAYMFGDKYLGTKTYMNGGSPSEGEATFEALLLYKCCVMMSATVAKKKSVVDVGMFNPKDIRAQDFDLWLRMAHAGAKIGYQRDVLVKYRVRSNSVSGNAVQRVQREIDVFNRIANTLKLTDDQQKIIDYQLERLAAEIEFQHGKSFILKEDFANAIKSFETANTYKNSTKLKVITTMLKISPRLLLKIYKKFRADEMPYMPK
jgi:glycosyltransferase involved in cell wall biosynthesis